VIARNVAVKVGFIQRQGMRHKQRLMATAAIGGIGQVGTFHPVGGVAVRTDKVQGIVHFKKGGIAGQIAGQLTLEKLG
jgi:hypothetical protein